MGFWEAINNLGGDIVNAFFSVYNQKTAEFVSPMLEVAKELIIANIDPYSFQNFWAIIVGVISATYLLIFFAVGLKFLFGSYDAVQRAEAKEWFKKAFMLVITVNASLLIYSLLLGLSSGMATYLWDTQFETLFSIQNLTTLDFIWLSIFALVSFLVVLTLVIRQIFLIAGVMLFPIGLYLFFIPPLKSYGSIILNIIGAAAFMNVLDTMILIAVQLFLNEFSYLNTMNLLAPTIGLFFIFIANTSLIIIAIKKALSAGGINISIIGTAKTAITGMTLL
jgi:hypothetical protein